MSNRSALSAALAVGALASVASAAISYQVSIVPSLSTLDSSTSMSAPVVGTFKGNFDEVNNPTGTKTIPGISGGSGNNPIDYSADVSASGDNTTHPSGGFELTVDTTALTCSVSGLAIDFLGGKPFDISATATVTYDTFHTQQPTAIFFGGFPVPIPLGVATIETLDVAQSGPAVSGTLTPAGRNVFNFAASVPVDLVATVIVNGQLLVTDPIPIALPIAGSIDFGGRSVVVTVSSSGEVDQTTPIDPPPSFIDQPVDLPTILPPGNTAHLLFSGSIASVTVAASFDFAVAADAVPTLDPADFNGDGVVGPADLAILLGAWGTSGPGDLDGDGIVGAADLAILLGSWG